MSDKMPHANIGLGGGGSGETTAGEGSSGAPPSTIESLHLKKQDDQRQSIARRLLLACLCRVSYDDCKVHHGGIELPNQFHADIEEAARAMKAAGLGWGEWT